MATIKITLNELKTIIKNVIKEETENKNFMGLKIVGNQILGYEPYFKKYVVVAHINHENQEVYPAHGYFIPHKYGKISKKYADSLGYNFNNQ